MLESDAVDGRCKKIAVIVPVYNAMPYLTDLLASIASQDMDKRSYDVVLINDGSTDGGASVLDRWVSDHPNARVIHQANSGWPGGPRNRGLENSASEYVFFADSDDILAPSAIRVMCDYADKNGADIVIPQMAGFAGRTVPKHKSLDSVTDVGLVDAFRTLGPIKLYRRALLDDNGIRFPEGRVRLEDGIFNAHAYVAAKRISIVRGDDYYLVRARDDGQNISVTPLGPEGYTRSVAEICSIVAASRIGQGTKEQIFLSLYKRKCLKIYAPGRFARYTEKRRHEWLAEHRKLIDRFITTTMEERLVEPFRTISKAVRNGDIAPLLGMPNAGAPPKLSAELAHAGWSKSGLSVEIVISNYSNIFLPQMLCELRRRDGMGLSGFPVSYAGGARGRSTKFSGLLPGESLSALRPGVYDMYVSCLFNKRQHVSCRVKVANRDELPGKKAGVTAYATKYGNFSLKARASSMQATHDPSPSTIRAVNGSDEHA